MKKSTQKHIRRQTHSSFWFTWVLLPLFIFLARAADVTMGTMRVVFVARGVRNLAVIFGFIEVVLFLLAIGKVMSNLSNPLYYIAYAGGFSFGTYIGMVLGTKMKVGIALVRIITHRDAEDLLTDLHEQKYRLSAIEALSAEGKLEAVIYATTRKRRLPKMVELIRKHNPEAFFTIEDVRHIHDVSILEEPSFFERYNYFGLHKFYQKAK